MPNIAFNRPTQSLCAALLLATLGACGDSNRVSDSAPGVVADSIYSGGPIITMQDDLPIAAAVAVKDGRILAVGSADDVKAFEGASTTRIDLDEKPLLPGFVDSHGHASMIGLQAMSANLLPPPDGEVSSVEQLVDTLNTWATEYPGRVERVGWIVGFGYDNAQLANGQHPTRDDLDRVSTDLPVVVIHQSGHLGVFNSKALELGGITAETENPAGGVYRRRPNSEEPDGVAEEYAFFGLLANLVARFDDEVNDTFVVQGTGLLASFGYTTGQDGRSFAPGIDAMRRVAARGELDIDLVAFPDILEIDAIDATREYEGRFRIAGAKITIDGSPQGKTAWLTEPYFVPPEGRDADYRGYAAVTDEQVREAVNTAFTNGFQILCHANGDAAIDLFVDAVRDARGTNPSAEIRPVLIHGQTLRFDQVAELDELGIFPSLFPMHTFYWGDFHRDSVLGPERAENISPTGWIVDRGMRFGTHHDAPVALPDSMRILSATVTRRTRSGQVLGAEQRVSVMTALKAMTIWPAWQHFEEDNKGSIEVGKLADFVILSENPLTVAQERLDDLEVVETVKEGVTIYRRP